MPENDPRYYFLYCVKCRNHTKHSILDMNPTQKIECIECGTMRADHIVSKRVKIEKGLWDCYVRRCGEQGIKVEG